MTGLLRKQLGFRGLLVTDAMDMSGVLARVTVAGSPTGSTATGNYGTIRNALSIGEACKLALAAGADVLLMPSDVPATPSSRASGRDDSRRRASTRQWRILEIAQLGLDASVS
jgi:beta-glucosidase-like glycosyl hydrolase